MTPELAWWLNQIGIIVEIIGAGYLVYCAWQSRRTVSGMKTDLDSIEFSVRALLKEVQSNFKNQSLGFILLALGLVMQFASNGVRS